MSGVTLAALPTPLDWAGEPQDWSVRADGTLSITSGPRADHFVDPSDGTHTRNGPLLLAPVEGDFRLSARVTPALRATYDAGTLFVHAGPATWAKLAMELSPQGVATVVSVVTRGLSDDCNHWPVDGGAVWLRVSRTGTSYALHASADGDRWDLVRYFTFDGPVRIGFGAQSPTGDGCTAAFDDVRFVPEGLADLRDGS